MAFSSEELAACLRDVGAFVAKRRPPEHVRHLVDLRAEIEQTAIVFIHHRLVMGREVDSPFARIRWTASRREWALYWRRANGKWFRYEPTAPIASLRDALDEIDRDPHGCFFG